MSYQKRSNILQELEQAIKKKVGDKSKNREQTSKILQSSAQKKKRLSSKQPTRQNRVTSTIKGKQIMTSINGVLTNQKNYENIIAKPVSLFNNQNLYGVDLKSAKGKKFTNRKWDKILSLINYMVSSSQKAIKYINSSNFQAQFAVKLYKSDKQNLQSQLKNFDFEDMLNDYKNPQKSIRTNQQNVNLVYEQNLKLKKQIVLLQKQAQRFQTFQSYHPTELTVNNEDDPILKRQLKKFQQCLNRLINENGSKQLKQIIQKQIKFEGMAQKSKNNPKKTQQIEQILQSLQIEKNQILLGSLKQISGSSQVSKSLNNTNRSHKLKQIQQQKQSLQKQLMTLKQKLQQIRNIEKIQKQNEMLKKNHSLLYANLMQIIKEVDDKTIQMQINEELYTIQTQRQRRSSHMLDCIKNHLKNNKQLLQEKQIQIGQLSYKMQKQYLKLKEQSQNILGEYELQIKKYQNEMHVLNKNIDKLERQVQNDQTIIVSLQQKLQAEKIKNIQCQNIQYLQQQRNNYKKQAQRLIDQLQKTTLQKQKIVNFMDKQNVTLKEVQNKLKLRQAEREYFFNQKEQNQNIHQQLLQKLGQNQEKLQNQNNQLFMSEQQNQQLNKQKQRLENQLKKLEQHNTQLLEWIQTHEGKQNNRKEELKTLNEQRQELRLVQKKTEEVQALLNHCKFQRQKLSEQLKISKNQIKTVMEEKQSLTEFIEKLKTQFQTIKQNLQLSQKKLILLQNQLSEKQIFKKKMESNIIQKEKQINQMIKENQQILKQKQECIQNLIIKCQNIQSQLQRQNLQNKEQQSKILQLQDHLKYYEENHTQLSQADFQFKVKVQNLQSQLFSLKKQKVELQEIRQISQKDKAEILILNEQLQESINIIQEMKEGFQSQKKRLEDDINNLQKIAQQQTQLTKNSILQLEQTKCQNKNLNFQIQQSNKQIQNVKSTLQILQQQINNLRQQQNAGKRQEKQLKNTLEQKQAIIIQLSNVSEIRQHEIKAKLKQIQKMENQLHRLKHERDQAHISKQKVSHELTKVKSEFEIYINQKDIQSQTENSQQMHRLALQIQHYKRQHESSFNKIKQLTQTIITQNKKIQGLCAQLQKIKTEKVENVQIIVKLQQEIKISKQLQQQTSRQLDQVKSQLSTSRQENIEEISKNVFLEKQIQQIQNQLFEKNKEFIKINVQNEQLKQKLEDFQQRMQLFRLQKQQIQSSKQNIQSLKSQIQTNTIKIKSLQKQIVSKNEELKKLEVQIKSMQEDKIHYENKASQISTISALKQKQYISLIKQILKGTSIQTEDLNEQMDVQALLAKAASKVIQLRKQQRQEESNRKKIEKIQRRIKEDDQNNYPINQFGTYDELDNAETNQALVSPIRLFQEKAGHESRDLKTSQLIVDMKKQKQDKQEDQFHCSMISQIPHLEQQCNTDRKDNEILKQLDNDGQNNLANMSNEIANISEFGQVQQDRMNSSMLSDTNLAESVSEAGSSPRKTEQQNTQQKNQRNNNQKKQDQKQKSYPQDKQQQEKDLEDFNDLKSQKLQDSFLSQNIETTNKISEQQGQDLDNFNDYNQEMNSSMMSEKETQEKLEQQPIMKGNLKANFQKETQIIVPVDEENNIQDFGEVNQNMNSSMLSNQSIQQNKEQDSPQKLQNKMLEEFDDYKSQTMINSSMLSEKNVTGQIEKIQQGQELADFNDYRPDKMSQSMLSQKIENQHQTVNKSIDGLDGFEDYQQNGLNDSVLSQKMDTDNINTQSPKSNKK